MTEWIEDEVTVRIAYGEPNSERVTFEIHTVGDRAPDGCSITITVNAGLHLDESLAMRVWRARHAAADFMEKGAGAFRQLANGAPTS